MNGTVNLQGKIHGSLACKGFYLRTRKAYYINHLFDNEINFDSLSGYYTSLDLNRGYDDQIIEFIH